MNSFNNSIDLKTHMTKHSQANPSVKISYEKPYPPLPPLSSHYHLSPTMELQLERLPNVVNQHDRQRTSTNNQFRSRQWLPYNDHRFRQCYIQCHWDNVIHWEQLFQPHHSLIKLLKWYSLCFCINILSNSNWSVECVNKH